MEGRDGIGGGRRQREKTAGQMRGRAKSTEDQCWAGNTKEPGKRTAQLRRESGTCYRISSGPCQVHKQGSEKSRDALSEGPEAPALRLLLRMASVGPWGVRTQASASEGCFLSCQWKMQRKVYTEPFTWVPLPSSATLATAKPFHSLMRWSPASWKQQRAASPCPPLTIT